MPVAETNSQFSLSALKIGQRGRVVALQGDDSMQTRLRELGFIENAVVTVRQVNGAICCQVGDSRFAIDRTFAEAVRVSVSR